MQVRTCYNTGMKSLRSKWDNVGGRKWLCCLMLCSDRTSRGRPNTAAKASKSCISAGGNTFCRGVRCDAVGRGMQQMGENQMQCSLLV